MGEACVIMVLNSQNSPRPLYRVESWAEVISSIDLFGIPPALLNDDKLGRCLELLAKYSSDIETPLCLKLIPVSAAISVIRRGIATLVGNVRAMHPCQTWS